MSTAYCVYSHSKGGYWGFIPPEADGATEVASISPKGVTAVTTVSAVRLAAVIQDKVRQGYTRLSQPKYLSTRVEAGVLIGEFVSAHPDLLTQQLQGTQLFFVALPRSIDVVATVDGWCRTLDGAPGNAIDRGAWLKHCFRVTTYLPALSCDPTGVLVVADWARSSGLPLVAVDPQALPAGRPADARHEWRSYLLNWCEERTVNEALEFLGWPLSDFLQGRAATEKTTTAHAGDWLVAAQQFTF
jgi:hypothetical protein